MIIELTQNDIRPIRCCRSRSAGSERHWGHFVGLPGVGLRPGRREEWQQKPGTQLLLSMFSNLEIRDDPVATHGLHGEVIGWDWDGQFGMKSLHWVASC